MNVVQLVKIPLRKLVLLSIVYFDILSADSIEESLGSDLNRTVIGAYRAAQTRHEPVAKLKQSVHINSTNHDMSFEVSILEQHTLPRIERSAFTVRLNYNYSVVESAEKPARNDSNHWQRPVFASNRKYEKLTFDPSTYVCSDKQAIECLNKTKEFRAKILSEFGKTLLEPIDESSNIYNVEYEHPDDMVKYNPTCMVLDAKLRILTKKDSPFDTNKIGRLFPTRKLFGKKFMSVQRSCVIVSSAGSLFESGLGKFIDNHDIVLRFNHAPTKGHEKDVGSKTTIRVVNSQVVSKREFNFVESPIFENVSIAAWDPGKFNGTLHDWISKPDFQLFKNYKRFMKRRPDAKFYLLDPRSIWNLWKALHIYTGLKIRQNPPSSGFIGLALLLPHCGNIDIVEYMPSTRLTSRCHYYDSEMNSACTFGTWHPLAAEKLMTYDMNSANDFATFQNGVIRIRKPKNNGCN
ncbi:beta-galactoside alpha-2,6-sialyltransferase 1 [Sitodiplosis mosellana]|uniref:beta-galactoside alpha-2,6-sialyltransferase 1 n=1 Tax=Sitodiplosis mosellana TaxID=263140 RepID=UPI002443CBB0|nr:beta-galactoside alpha-2,6-sialyltransferase 1 [Sitodiplosis mosellana]